jgi:hypothetical protein
VTDLQYDVDSALAELMTLIPLHTRVRDNASGKTLEALLRAVAGELASLENDIDELYSSWFIETCPEWVVPYIADLVGVTDLPPDLSAGGSTGAAVSRRAVVANTVAYRRRKGTAAVIEQVARDVTGWPSKAIEYFRLLAATTHLNHVHTDRMACASLRDAEALDLVPPAIANGALDRLSHTTEVRHIGSGRGRYGIPNVGVFLFPLQVYAVTEAQARQVAPGRWTVDPLGHETPLFAVPTTETQIEHLAAESDLPVPLRPRRLLAILSAARGAGASDQPLPIEIVVDDDPPLEVSRVRVCGLEDLERDVVGDVVDGWQVMVDAVIGVLHPYLDGAPADPESITISYSYGSMADVGAGPYDRSEIHETSLEVDPYSGISTAGGRDVIAQIQVVAAGTVPGAVDTIVEGLAATDASWAAVQSTAGATSVLSIGDSATYAEDLAVSLPESTRLVLVAATWDARVLANGDVLAAVPGVYNTEGVRPSIIGDLVVTGATGSSLAVDGIVLDGDLVVAPGALGSLSVSQCTIRGHIRVESAPDATNQDLAVLVNRSRVSGVDLVRTVPELTICDSIVDPAADPDDPTAQAVEGAGLHLAVEGSTLRGAVDVRTLDASSTVFDGPARVEDRQVGCIRFSYIGPGSRVPRRFRCVPSGSGAGTSAGVAGYVSVEPGSPSYLVLGAGCPASIREGSEGGADMGVHRHLERPLRVDAARRLLEPYVPVGLEIGIVGS